MKHTVCSMKSVRLHLLPYRLFKVFIYKSFVCLGMTDISQQGRNIRRLFEYQVLRNIFNP
jgi:hypothetical protein